MRGAGDHRGREGGERGVVPHYQRYLLPLKIEVMVRCAACHHIYI